MTKRTQDHHKQVASKLLLLIVISSLSSGVSSNRRVSTQQQDLKLIRNFQTSDNKHVAGRRHAHRNEREHAPKLIHQPQSIVVKADEPHTIECAIEAKPTAEIKWFKDGLLFISQAPHSEQQNNELMFFQVNDEDTGNYHCEATNYLGTLASNTFRLTVQSSVHDPRLRLEPRQAEAGEDQQVEYTCTLPVLPSTRKTRQQLEPEVSWKRDGKKLSVKWLDEDEELGDARSRFVARKLVPTSTGGINEQLQFSLTITRVQLKDDNSTFTCLYQMPSIYSKESDGKEEKLAHESSPASLRVYSEIQIPSTTISTLSSPDLKLGPAPYDILNKTTQLLSPSSEREFSAVGGNQLGSQTGRPNTLKQSLMDLFEIAKPTLIIFGILFLVSLFVMLTLIYMRHNRHRSQNRYMKHTSLVQQTYSVSSAGSGSSSGVGAGGVGGGSCALGENCFGVDPMLNSLMARTLSASNGGSLVGSGLGSKLLQNNLNGKGPSSNNNGVGGLSKKYRSYRDHMRKIADKTNDPIIAHSGGGCDFLDANFVSQLRQQLQLESQSASTHPLEEQTLEKLAFISNQTHATNLSRPNLYNQSLAAREQAKSLLQASEHMRSLSNLNAIAAIQHQQQHQQQKKHQLQQASCRFGNQNGSNLNLPLSFVFGNTDNSMHQMNGTGPLWASHTDNGAQQMRQQQQNHLLNGARNLLHANNANTQDEHYQLVNCSSVSPSSSSSVTTGGSSSGNGTMTTTTNSTQFNGQLIATSRQTKESISSSNHYSTIEANDDEECYEAVDCQQNDHDSNNQISFRVNSRQRTSTFVARKEDEEMQTGSREAGNIVEDSLGRRDFGKRDSRKVNTKGSEKAEHKGLNFQDQLSPYAVSSICGNVPPPSHKQPPANNEAMRALNEQFEISQLVLLEEQSKDLPSFEAPPPPPPQNDNLNGS